MHTPAPLSVTPGSPAGRRSRAVSMAVIAAILAMPIALAPAAFASAENAVVPTDVVAVAADAPAESAPAAEPAPAPAEEPAAEPAVPAEEPATEPDAALLDSSAPSGLSRLMAVEAPIDAPVSALLAAPIPVPTNVTNAPYTGGVAVYWSAVTVDSGSLLQYTVKVVAPSGDTTYYTTWDAGYVIGLDESGVHSFSVAAVVDGVVGSYSPTVTAAPLLSAANPSAVQNLTVTPGEGFLQVDWDAPLSPGTTSSYYYYPYYSVQYREHGAEGWWNWGTAYSTDVVIGGLPVGQSYDVRVRAVSYVESWFTYPDSSYPSCYYYGWGYYYYYGYSDYICYGSFYGPFASVLDVTASILPGTPPGLAATADDASVSLGWTEPSTGGAAITGYDVQYITDSDEGWIDAASTTTPQADIAGLVNGVSYEFHVRAVNANGDGPWSDGVFATPVGVPGDVENAALTPIDSGFAATWDEPADNGGAAIQDYDLSFREVGDDAWSAFSVTDTAASVPDLVNGVEYDVRVRAVNGGTTPAQWLSLGSVVAGLLPGAPLELGVFSKPSAIDVTWSAPADGGSSAVTGYEVRWIPTDVHSSFAPYSSVDVATTSTTITGLTNSVSYDIDVRAINASGRGPWTEVSQVIPVVFAPTFTAADGSSLVGEELKAGDTVIVAGAGALPDASVWVELHSTPVLLGTTTAAADGTYRLVVTIPAGTVGSHTLVAFLGMGGGIIGTADIAISVPAVAAAAGLLAFTGMNDELTSAIAWAALLLLLAGAFVVIRAKRREVHAN